MTGEQRAGDLRPGTPEGLAPFGFEQARPALAPVRVCAHDQKDRVPGRVRGHHSADASRPTRHATGLAGTLHAGPSALPWAAAVRNHRDVGLDPFSVAMGVLVILALLVIASLAGGIAARAFLDASADEPRKPAPRDRPPR